jgi:hypothetical protein
MDRTTLLLLAPLVAIDLGFRIAAFVSWYRTPKTRGPRWAWLLGILLVNFGWVAWFLLGKAEEEQ